MPVAQFLQLLGFLLVAFNTAIAAFAIYVFQTGGSGIDDLFIRFVQEVEPSPTLIVWAIVIFAWAAISLPAFILWANGLSTEAQLLQSEFTTRHKKEAEKLSEALAAIQKELAITNGILRESERK